MKKLSIHEAYLKRMLFRPAAATLQGMTLIELLVVIVIVGILSAVAIPSLLTHIRRSKVAEAQTALTAISRGSEVYRMDFTVYPTDYADIEFGGIHADRYLQDPWQAPNYHPPEVVPPVLNLTGIRWMTEARIYVISTGDPLRCDIGLGDRRQEVLLSGYDLRHSCNTYQ
ncbi:type IV pilin protein [Thermostichus vulcanus]|uniref:Prepilin-type N-terminal cleavage/methylation domain-containing protein n=1 Tax=Thermostichus vulcanus str. 'Rupite' TaxID=2813851 RepID=A0ABT0C963_THEVL|nr:prepilin-type N-terminal cleavage/methylation domain-containing protein [Thermostichus vulcanus]MCJ2541885.1 prepilin-type N-terminal cleavage/methylation domain-containing protein [Thermostichus vulcanus str. 'Rupite']